MSRGDFAENGSKGFKHFRLQVEASPSGSIGILQGLQAVGVIRSHTATPTRSWARECWGKIRKFSQSILRRAVYVSTV